MDELIDLIGDVLAMTTRRTRFCCEIPSLIESSSNEIEFIDILCWLFPTFYDENDEISSRKLS